MFWKIFPDIPRAKTVKNKKHRIICGTALFWWCSSFSLSYPYFVYRSKLLFFLFFWKWIACCTLSQCMLSKLKMPITTGWYNIFFRREGYIIRIFCSGVTILPLIVWQGQCFCFVTSLSLFVSRIFNFN